MLEPASTQHYLYRVQEIAEMTRFSPETILRAIRNGQLKANRFGQRAWRVARPDFKDWLARGTPTGPELPDAIEAGGDN